MIKKVKNTMSLLYVISHFKGEVLLERFPKKNYEKQNKKNLG